MGVRERLGKGLSLMRGKRFFYVVVGAGLFTLWRERVKSNLDVR